MLRGVPTDPTGSEGEEHGEQDKLAAAAGGVFVLVGIVEATLRVGGQDGAVGELGAEGNVDFNAAVDGPAIGLEQRAKRALAELELGDEHLGARDGSD
jgi:hypothetical protein